MRGTNNTYSSRFVWKV